MWRTTALNSFCWEQLLSKPTNAIELWISCSHCCHCRCGSCKIKCIHPARLLIQNFQICALNGDRERVREIECMIWRFVWLSCHINMVDLFFLFAFSIHWLDLDLRFSINYLNWSLSMCFVPLILGVVWVKPQYLMCVEIFVPDKWGWKASKIYTGSISASKCAAAERVEKLQNPPPKWINVCTTWVMEHLPLSLRRF